MLPIKPANRPQFLVTSQVLWLHRVFTQLSLIVHNRKNFRLCGTEAYIKSKIYSSKLTILKYIELSNI